MIRTWISAGLCAFGFAFAGCAWAVDPAVQLDGRALSTWWILPFAGVLLSIAILPLATPSLWHHHYGKITALWSLAALVPLVAVFGFSATARQVWHTAVSEYMPFIILLVALYTVTGGIHIKGNLHGSPAVNTGFLATGSVLASVMGTTGAAMLLIRPLLRANDARAHNKHVVIFFIFLVANIGGSLTPLGDPPLFLGFLKGVDFFWVTRALILPMALATVILLAVFFAIDTWLYRQANEKRPDPTPDSPIRIEGWFNLAVLLPAILAVVLVSGVWNPGITYEVYGTTFELQGLTRDAGLVAVILLSWLFTPRSLRRAHHFEWGPMVEVAKLFAGIFVTIIPAIAILRAGHEGAMAPLLSMVTAADGQPSNVAYFWATGALSSFLDNAPTYLVFFNLAGGDPQALMGPLAQTLAAISAGAVFMGANTYIGNAPNFMVKAVAEARGVRMPSFGGYMVWSGLILLPLFALITVVFFR
jgi:Na+/H+ antiporter NhaD/arsenite permease-like protein